MSATLADHELYERDLSLWAKRQVAALRLAAEQRGDIRRILKRSPGLYAPVGSLLAECHEDALEPVRLGMPENERWPDLPTECPYRVDQLLDRDWWPRRAGT